MNLQSWIASLDSPFVLLGLCVVVAARTIGPIIKTKFPVVPHDKSYGFWKLIVSRATIIILTIGVLLISVGFAIRWHDIRRSRDQTLVQMQASLDEQIANDESLSNCRSIVDSMMITVREIGKIGKTNAPLLHFMFQEASSNKHPTIIGCIHQAQSMMDEAEESGTLTNLVEMQKLAKAKAKIGEAILHTEEKTRFVCDELATKWEVKETAYQNAKLVLTEFGIPNLSPLTAEQLRIRQNYKGFSEFYPQWRRALQSVVGSDRLEVNSLAELHWQSGRLLHLADAIARDHRSIASKSFEVQQTLKSHLAKIEKGSPLLGSHVKTDTAAASHISEQ